MKMNVPLPDISVNNKHEKEENYECNHMCTFAYPELQAASTPMLPSDGSTYEER
jgi:hypothetical protein